jgi:hypothetical protein
VYQEGSQVLVYLAEFQVVYRLQCQELVYHGGFQVLEYLVEFQV